MANGKEFFKIHLPFIITNHTVIDLQDYSMHPNLLMHPLPSVSNRKPSWHPQVKLPCVLIQSWLHWPGPNAHSFMSESKHNDSGYIVYVKHNRMLSIIVYSFRATWNYWISQSTLHYTFIWKCINTGKYILKSSWHLKTWWWLTNTNSIYICKSWWTQAEKASKSVDASLV